MYNSLTLTGCSDNVSRVKLNTPDKINIYADGNKKELTKSGNILVQTPFYKINEFIGNGKEEEVQFTEVIIPLNEEWRTTAFIKTNDGYYSPVGLRNIIVVDLDKLVKESIK